MVMDGSERTRIAFGPLLLFRSYCNLVFLRDGNKLK